MPGISPFIVSKGIISGQWAGDKIFGKDNDVSLLRDGLFYKLLGFFEVFFRSKLMNGKLHNGYFYAHISSKYSIESVSCAPPATARRRRESWGTAPNRRLRAAALNNPT